MYRGSKDQGLEISWDLDLRDARAAGRCRSSDPLLLSVYEGIPTPSAVDRAEFPQMRRMS